MPVNLSNLIPDKGESYLDLEARRARAIHLVRNDYDMDEQYPDNLDSYEEMCGYNVFDIKV